jgi:hypothetical protein
MAPDSRPLADPVGIETYQMVFGKWKDKPLIGLREFTINDLFAKGWSRSRPPADEARMITLKQRSMITVAHSAKAGDEFASRSRSSAP